MWAQTAGLGNAQGEKEIFIRTTILWKLVFLRRFSTTQVTEETAVLIEKGISRVT
jgi:hypothetical protein